MAREPESGTTPAPAQLYRSVCWMASGASLCEPDPIGPDTQKVPSRRSGSGGSGGLHTCVRGGGRNTRGRGSQLLVSISPLRKRIECGEQNDNHNRKYSPESHGAVPVSYSPFSAAKATGLSGDTVSSSVLCIRFSKTNQWAASPIPETRQFAAWYRKILPLSTAGELRAGDSLPRDAPLRYTGRRA